MTTAESQQVPKFELRHRLVLAREHAGLRQDEMAEHLGLSHSAVSLYERGKSVPKLAILRVWAIRCGVPLEWLLDEGGDQPESQSRWITDRMVGDLLDGMLPLAVGE